MSDALRGKETDAMSSSLSFGRLALIAACFLLSSMVGVGIYHHSVVIPSWFENPPESLKRINQYGESELRFWIPLQAATLVCLVLALAAAWRQPTRRALILAILGGYVAVAAVTALYFAPQIVEWGKTNPSGALSPQFKSASQRWLMLSWVRQGVLIVGDLLLLTALASPDRE
jgi:NADH:ubiquinone oxidoreductase subunit 2 (subunit N)